MRAISQQINKATIPYNNLESIHSKFLPYLTGVKYLNLSWGLVGYFEWRYPIAENELISPYPTPIPLVPHICVSKSGQH